MIQTKTTSKYLHLFLFIFLNSEIAYGGVQGNPYLALVRKFILVLAIFYTIVNIALIPMYLRVVATMMALFILYLVVESVDLYGASIETMSFISQMLYPTIVVGSFVACRSIHNFKFDKIVSAILVLFLFNQLILGNIFNHQFNSEIRSTTAGETYYLVIPLLYFYNLFLLKNERKYFIYFILTFAFIILLFHRTVWITSSISILINTLIIRKYNSINFSKLTLYLVPSVAIIVIATILFVLNSPKVLLSISDSFNDIQNANSQGTGGWRSEQRDHYLELVADHPILGWTIDGYDKGEVMTTEDSDWLDKKGNFIHSGYVNALYNFGIVGLFMQYSLLLFINILLVRHSDKSNPVDLCLLIFSLSGWIFSWSYQLPEFFWGFMGIALFIGLQRKYTMRYLNFNPIRHKVLESF